MVQLAGTLYSPGNTNMKTAARHPMGLITYLTCGTNSARTIDSTIHITDSVHALQRSREGHHRLVPLHCDFIL